VLAFLERREMLWTHGRLQAEVLSRAGGARERLLAIFDVFGEWFSAKTTATRRSAAKTWRRS
jgi:hypothetical protein